MQDVKARKLIQILCSSFYISSYSDQELSIPDLAVDLLKLKGSHQDELDIALKEFDGYSFDDVQVERFQSRKNSLKKNLVEYIRKFQKDAPKPIKENENTYGVLYKVEEGFNGNIENSIIEKWFDKFISIGGNKCYAFAKKDLSDSTRKLEQIANIEIKLNAMTLVYNQVSLKGEFSFYKFFDSVPDACRYFRMQLGDEYTRDLLKKEIKNKAQIYEDGGVLNDWPKINKRINAWAQHERKKYKR